MTTFEELKKKFETLNNLSEKTIISGWIDGNGTARKAKENLVYRNKTGKLTPSLKAPASNALIARTLNYGRKEGTTAEGVHYPEIPKRPFLRIAMEKYRALAPKIEQKYIPRIISGQASIEMLCLELGNRLKDCITQAMRESDKYEPLHESTLEARRKQGRPSSIPLIDTHQLIDSVSLEIK